MKRKTFKITITDKKGVRRNEGVKYAYNAARRHIPALLREIMSEGQTAERESWTNNKPAFTYGEELEQVKKADPLTVWTICEGDDGALYACAGFHIVNRLFYVITEEKHTQNNETFVF